MHTKRKSNPNTALYIVIKPQDKRTKEEGKNNKCWRGCGENVDGKVNWYSHYGEQYGGSLKI